MSDRIVIVGGARCGKSWLARELRRQGYATYCGDPVSKVKEPEPDVTYLPEGLAYSGDGGAADWVATHWFPMPGRWVCEGHVMARALQRMLDAQLRSHCIMRLPDLRIIVFTEQFPGAATLPGQVAQHKGVMTTWNRISSYFPAAEYR